MIAQLWGGPPGWGDLELGEVDDHAEREYDDCADPGPGVRRAGFHARLRVGYVVRGGKWREGYDVFIGSGFLVMMRGNLGGGISVWREAMWQVMDDAMDNEYVDNLLWGTSMSGSRVRPFIGASGVFGIE